MAWRRPGDKPLSEPMTIILLTHIWVTRPQWLKHYYGLFWNESSSWYSITFPLFGFEYTGLQKPLKTIWLKSTYLIKYMCTSVIAWRYEWHEKRSQGQFTTLAFKTICAFQGSSPLLLNPIIEGCCGFRHVFPWLKLAKHQDPFSVYGQDWSQPMLKKYFMSNVSSHNFKSDAGMSGCLRCELLVQFWNEGHQAYLRKHNAWMQMYLAPVILIIDISDWMSWWHNLLPVLSKCEPISTFVFLDSAYVADNDFVHNRQTTMVASNHYDC